VNDSALPSDPWAPGVRAADVPAFEGSKTPRFGNVADEFDMASDIDSRAIEVTFFQNETAQTLRIAKLTLRQLAHRIAVQAADSKTELPLLKLAIFGTQRSDKNSLRTNRNLLHITGVEVEHDSGVVSFDAALDVMRQARIRALIYTSPSYIPEFKERWRILVPLSQNHPPENREKFVARINGLFGGEIAPESFVLSQAYYYGHVNNPEHSVEVIDGEYLDLRDDTYAGSIFKDGSKVGDQVADGGSRSSSTNSRINDDPQPVDREELEAALFVINSNCSYEKWLKIAAGLRYALGEAGYELFDRWSARATGNAADGTPLYTPEKSRERWRGARTMSGVSTGTIFYYADQADPDWRDRYRLECMKKVASDSDETTVDTGSARSPADDWDDSEDDEREANEAPVALKLPVIKVHKRISQLTTETQQMLIGAGVPFYQRGSDLVRPIVRTVKAADGRMTKAAQLSAVNPTYMRDTMCRHAHWERFDERRQEWVRTMAPLNVAQTLLARDGVWSFPKVVGVIACPTMRPDGSLLVKQGYDKATRLILIEPPTMPPILDMPTRQDALEALALLEHLVCESPFEDEASKSVALSGLITPVVRGAMTVAPMHVSSAPTAGTGKSFLWDMVAAIAIGQRRIPVVAVSNAEETEKRLGGVLLTGQPLISIDNVNGPLKGDFLCQAIEQQYLDLRPLGSSKIVRVEAGSTTIFATGNNISIVGDLCRRTITSRLDAELESPQLRQFKYNPIKSILEDRGKYIAACLTICRAYIVAGYPGVLPRLASFEAWSDVVRSALVWLGKADPLDRMEEVRDDDPERDLLGQVLRAWAKDFGVGAGSDVLLTVIVDRATQMRSGEGYVPTLEPVYPEFNAAVRAASGTVGNAKVDVGKFGVWCRSHKGRIVDGLRLMNKPSNRGGSAKWWVEKK
jgi:putative DNA primase/helicase